MNKLILGTMLAVGLCGCENETVVREVVKQTVVHDTIVKYKYRTHECSQEYGVDYDNIDGEVAVYEIRKKSNDEIVYYLQPHVIKNRIEKNGANMKSYKLECTEKDNEIYCYFGFKKNGKSYSFFKTWPSSNYYMMETWASNITFGTLTVSNPLTPPPK